MELTHLDDAVKSLEKANADMAPELLTVAEAQKRLKVYAHARKLVDYGVAVLAARIDNASNLARETGTSMGKAKETIATSKIVEGSGPLKEAFEHGTISLDQARDRQGRGGRPRLGKRASRGSE